MGRSTRSAIESYQSDNGYLVDGMPDQGLILQLEQSIENLVTKNQRQGQATNDQSLLAEMQTERDRRESERAKLAIKRAIECRWLQPARSAGKNLNCYVRVGLGSSGSVLLVNIEKSSGNLSFDRSVEQAVYKADPLPMPKSPSLLAQFREIVLKFDPGK